MKQLLKILAIIISVGSAVVGILLILQYLYYKLHFHSDDSLLMILFFILGLPLTFFANFIGVLLLGIFDKSWLVTLTLAIAYFVQWQGIALWLWCKSESS